MQVVPTRHVDLRGGTRDTYEYSSYFNEFSPARRGRRELREMREETREMEHQRMLPNAVLSYDISPYRVVHTQSGDGFFGYLTQLCAVVGGVFTVFGIIDGMLYNSIKVIKRD